LDLGSFVPVFWPLYGNAVKVLFYFNPTLHVGVVEEPIVFHQMNFPTLEELIPTTSGITLAVLFSIPATMRILWRGGESV
jgi:hypothetical protein